MKKTTEEIYIKIGRQMANLRKEKNLSQAQLAKKLNVRQQLIADYEIARSRMSIIFLFKLAEMLSSDVIELLGFEKKEKRGPSSKLQKKIDALQKLPIDKQKLVLNLIDTILQGHDNSKLTDK